MNAVCELPPQVFRLGNAAGLQIALMAEGATWLSCTVPLADGSRRELLLGCRDAAEYRRQRSYLGATIGRFTNRIRDSRFMLDGRMVQLSPNEGPHHLHGGPSGFDRREWAVEQHDSHGLTLTLVSPDGDQGYPGEVRARVRYALGEDLSLTISFEATSSAPCPVGLTHHAYFNLDGDRGGDTRSALRQRLRVAADHWLPTDDKNLASAALAQVEGTGLDLRAGPTLLDAIHRDPVLQAGHGFDHSLSLDPSVCDGEQVAAKLSAADGLVRMQLSTDQPALQVYTGQGLAGVVARDGRLYQSHAGIALEPQFPPDSPNHAVQPPLWPDCILRPGRIWRAQTRLRFHIST